jgi:hypothetical protein
MIGATELDEAAQLGSPGIVRSSDGLGAWSITRRAPYTESGIKRLKCIRCGGRAQFQWQICSDGNNHRPLCGQCDVLLNRLVLQWMGHPAADELVERYAASKAPNVC